MFYSDVTFFGEYFGALSYDERVSILGEVIIDFGVFVFMKSYSGRYMCVDNVFFKVFGFEKFEDVVGFIDDEVIEKIFVSGKIFYYLY